MTQEFASKIDTWILLVLLLTIVVSLVSSIAIIKSKQDLIGYFSAIVLLTLCTALPLWLLLDTNYTVSNENLTIRSGPRIWSIPISTISSIEATRESWSSPALSLDRLKIYYNNGHTVMISPEDKQGFLEAVAYVQ